MQFKPLTIALALAVGIAAPALAQPNAQAGQALFDVQCKACHLSPIAPPLKGVAGRSVATVPGFAFYSDALKAKSGQKWTDANLNAYLTSPPAWAPGTKMMLPVPDAANRANIIAYLKTLK